MGRETIRAMADIKHALLLQQRAKMRNWNPASPLPVRKQQSGEHQALALSELNLDPS